MSEQAIPPNNSAHDNSVEASPLLEQLTKYFSGLKINHKLVKFTRADKGAKYINIGGEDIALYYVLRAVLFSGLHGSLLVITTMGSLLDYVVAARSQHFDLTCIDFADSAHPAMFDQGFHTYCAVPKHFRVQGILDEIIKNFPADSNIYLPTGSNDVVLQVALSDYLQLHADLPTAPLSVALEAIDRTQELELSRESIIKKMNKISLTEKRMKARINETFEMPVMPNMADQLLQLRINPAADAGHLGKLVKKDPSLSAQLISWACSPYYGYSGKITSVEDAIIKVLGFDLVMNIALGIAIGQMMTISNEGKLGLAKYWRHSLYNASFIEILVKQMPDISREQRGLAYLCGLLHNFGHLLLGQVFPQQYHVLNQMVLANPDISILDIENYLFNTDHQKIGAWLMQLWHMPEELIVAVAHHHDTTYTSASDARYANLVLITNRLLASKEVGDEFVYTDLPDHVLANLNLPKTEIIALFDKFWSNRSGLDNIINTMAPV